MKILSNKKYNDLISKQFRGIFADVNDDNLLRENGLLYGENKELQKEIERLNNIIKEAKEKLNTQLAFTSSYQLNYQSAMNIIEEAKSILDREMD